MPDKNETPASYSAGSCKISKSPGLEKSCSKSWLSAHSAGFCGKYVAGNVMLLTLL